MWRETSSVSHHSNSHSGGRGLWGPLNPIDLHCDSAAVISRQERRSPGISEPSINRSGEAQLKGKVMSTSIDNPHSHVVCLPGPSQSLHVVNNSQSRAKSHSVLTWIQPDLQLQPSMEAVELFNLIERVAINNTDRGSRRSGMNNQWKQSWKWLMNMKVVWIIQIIQWILAGMSRQVKVNKPISHVRVDISSWFISASSVRLTEVSLWIWKRNGNAVV